MATPAYQLRDETAGLTLVTPGGETREQTRYLFMPLDLIDPARKRQDPKMRMGGEEVISHCLRRSQFRNFLPRCTFVPLEKWFEPIGIPELAGDRMGDLVTVSQPPVQRPVMEFTAPQLFRAPDPIKGLQCYPGADLPLIMEVAGHRGVRPIEAMRGIEWDAGQAQALQEDFFPSDWPLPTQLRLVEEQIKRVGERSDLHGQIAEQALESCATARHYGQAYINVQHGLLRTRQKHNWTYAYSSIAQQVLDQLELAPFEEGSQAMALLQTVLEKVVGQQQQPVDIAEIVKQVMIATQAAQAPHVPVTEAAATGFKCDFCEETFDTPQGKSMHETRWCKSKPE